MTLVLSEPVKAQTLVELIVERLEAAIVSGQLAPGTRISEQGLARQMNVSRGPLREALRRLEGRKLVERTPNKGARVVSLSKEDLDSLLVIREALEGMAARLAAERVNAAEIAGLQALLTEHADMPGLREGTGYLQEPKDRDFHFRIIKASGNQRLVAILCEDLYDLLRVYRYQSSRVAGRARQAFEEHGRIVAAIAAHDPDAAEQAMREHLRNGRAQATSGLAMAADAPAAAPLRDAG